MNIFFHHDFYSFLLTASAIDISISDLIRIYMVLLSDDYTFHLNIVYLIVLLE